MWIWRAETANFAVITWSSFAGRSSQPTKNKKIKLEFFTRKPRFFSDGGFSSSPFLFTGVCGLSLSCQKKRRCIFIPMAFFLSLEAPYAWSWDPTPFLTHWAKHGMWPFAYRKQFYIAIYLCHEISIHSSRAVALMVRASKLKKKKGVKKKAEEKHPSISDPRWWT